MAAPSRAWKVAPHGPLTEIDDGILAVVGEVSMPLVDLPRRMTVVRLRGGRLVVWSAVSLDEPSMARLEAFGVPAFLVVPGEHHRLDAPAWKARYPKLVVVAPAGSRAAVAEAVPVDTTGPDFDDPDVRFVAVPGTREHEAALVVRRPGGTTLVVNDVVANIRHPEGFAGWVLKAMGFAGDHAQVPKPEAMLVVKDKAALREQLLRWAGIEDLKRIVVAHGDVIEGNARETLRELAAELA